MWPRANGAYVYIPGGPGGAVDGLRGASEQKMQFSKAIAKFPIFAMACLPSVWLDFPCCKNQPQKSKLLQ
jgi:hypothetical protein